MVGIQHSKRNTISSLVIFIIISILIFNVIFFSGCNFSEKKEYSLKLTEWDNYKSETSSIYKKYKEKIKLLDEKYLEAAVVYNFPLAEEIAGRIIETYDNYIKELTSVVPPNLALELHNYQIESIKLERLKWLDISKDYRKYAQLEEGIKIKILKTTEKAKAEIEVIENSFKLEAEKLGIQRD